MQPPAPHPVLHLVNDPPPHGHTAPAAWSHRHTADYRRTDPDRPARHAVARANLLAGGMSPLDARWVMARRVAEQLEGGRAAILSPDRRRALISTALRMGLREFDANLVIAIVQDGRRIGTGALAPSVESRLALLPQATPAAPSRLSAWLPVAAAALGLLICAGLVLWLRTP